MNRLLWQLKQLTTTLKWVLGGLLVVASVWAIIELRQAILYPDTMEPWTGLAADPTPVGTSLPQVRIYQTEKTLWDWLELLLVPGVLTVGGIIFSYTESRRQTRIEDERAQEEALQSYLDQMSELIQNLQGSPASLTASEVAVVKTRTLILLARLSGRRKRSVLEFLYDVGLVYREDKKIKRKNILRLSNADFNHADLTNARLGNVNLVGAKLADANMYKASLQIANLRSARLSGASMEEAFLLQTNLIEAELENTRFYRANLSGAKLANTKLSNASFIEANCTDVNFSNADFRGARLDNADFSNANLSSAKNLKISQMKKIKRLRGATLPNGKLYDGRFRLKGDLKDAQNSSIDIHDSNAMGAFYRNI